ncbi:MAG: DUF2283 domain-containing protein [Sedimentisphaerales bacterium]|jgi:uncharacterized protein YuzE|nr:DUF2283 domain-containing protein [Planctomycetota bacterium]MDY0355886.1 DUF2283 domain-containing protein [Sedimentisphaerales bacterium]
MKFTYDPRYNVGYIRFKNKKADAESIKLSEELVIDLAPDGTVYGIELLNANDQMQRDDTGQFAVINEETGEETKFALQLKKARRKSRTASAARSKRRPPGS